MVSSSTYLARAYIRTRDVVVVIHAGDIDIRGGSCAFRKEKYIDPKNLLKVCEGGLSIVMSFFLTTPCDLGQFGYLEVLVFVRVVSLSRPNAYPEKKKSIV